MKVQRILIFVAIIASVPSAQGQGDPQGEFDRLCSFDFLFSEATVGRDFLLRVSFHGVPVAGTQITLNRAINTSGNGVAATAKTDSRGIARFRTIPEGSYPDSTEGLRFRASLIKVAARHASSETVEVDWSDHFIGVRNLRGTFDTSEELGDPVLPLRNAVVELREIHTARLIESTQTDANGDFELATGNPGIYALRLILPKKDPLGTEDRDLAIELSPNGKEYSIPEMTVTQSDCAGIQLFRKSITDDRWEEQQNLPHLYTSLRNLSPALTGVR